MTAEDKNPTEKKTCFVEPMTDREWQRHVLRMARRNGWSDPCPFGNTRCGEHFP